MVSWLDGGTLGVRDSREYADLPSFRWPRLGFIEGVHCADAHIRKFSNLLIAPKSACLAGFDAWNTPEARVSDAA